MSSGRYRVAVGVPAATDEFSGGCDALVHREAFVHVLMPHPAGSGLAPVRSPCAP